MTRIDPSMVREFRGKRAWSQEELSRKSGIGLRTVKKMESEDASEHTFRADIVAAIAGALGVEPAELMQSDSSERALTQINQSVHDQAVAIGVNYAPLHVGSAKQSKPPSD